MNKFSINVIAQSFLLPFILGIILFVSAGTLKYTEAWIYCLVFLVSVMSISLYFLKYDKPLIERRLKTKIAGTGEKITYQKIIQMLASLIFISIYIICGLDYRFSWSNIPSYISYLLNIPVLLAFLIVFIVFRINSFTSSIIEVDDNQKLITTGPYKFVRHPMYFGGILLLIFTPLALGSLWGLLIIVPMIILIILRLFNEENYLLNNLKGYDNYCKETKYRLIPFIW